ncbi:MAG: tRNA guanosine(34) transglycosylase Tgt [Sedimentisphaerales bacterium]|nr:tRNA guanosine(34) transglycosylase Tgt [Sedimentisphaerales bacterium]
MSGFELKTIDKNSSARRGVLTTAHGPVQTPAFMPVGTAGAVKGVIPEQIRRSGAEIILANTYHLMLRPGVDVIEQIGGLHKFMAWPGPILTDSGGYQVFSLASLTKITDAGVEFASHVDGAKVYLDAERATGIQNRLAPDIAMCLDQCPPFGCEPKELASAVDRTIDWAKRCKDAHKNQNQMLFAVVQGGIDRAMREKCAAELVKLDFDGYAIGGLAIGEGHDNMLKTVKHTAALLPENKPRYLMGVGMPADIVAAVLAGVDMFDCVLPTRNARNAYAFTMSGPLRLRNNEHINDSGPIETGCDCYACENFTRAAIRHFFNVGEMLGPILTTIHNLRFYQRLMAEIRRQIEAGDFAHWAREQLDKFEKWKPAPL